MDLLSEMMDTSSTLTKWNDGANNMEKWGLMEIFVVESKSVGILLILKISQFFEIF